MRTPSTKTLRRPSRLVLLALGVGLSVAAPIVVPSGGIGQTSIAEAATTTVGLWSGTAVPAVPSASDTAAVEVGTRFKTDVNGYVTGIRFYKGRTNTGVHTAQLWDASGASIGKATFSGETASGWQSVSFAAPIRVYAGRTYTASYYARAGRYAITKFGFSTPLRSGPLTTQVGAGVYRYGASGFPSGTYEQSNYWVDVQFSADGPVPTAAPLPTTTPTQPAPTASPAPSVAPAP